MNKSVFLCGFMGCGKSTAGRKLALMLNREFVDMDEFIINKLGMSIPRIFAEKGETFFREAETDAVIALSQKSSVIACGGGAMLNRKNAELAKQNGVVVFIDVDFQTCYDRIKNGKNRPIVNSSTMEELNIIYDGRIPLYRTNSDFTVLGDGSPMDVAERIAKIVNAE